MTVSLTRKEITISGENTYLLQVTDPLYMLTKVLFKLTNVFLLAIALYILCMSFNLHTSLVSC